MKKKKKIGKENEASFEIFGNIRFVEMGSSSKLNNYLGETRQMNEPGVFNPGILDEVW
jgi:hypothetical protein